MNENNEIGISLLFLYLLVILLLFTCYLLAILLHTTILPFFLFLYPFLHSNTIHP